MGLEKVFSLTSFVFSCVIGVAVMLVGGEYSQAQTGAASSQSLTSQPSKFQSPANQQVPGKQTKPYRLSSRVHMQSGTNRGYLVVRVDLAKGSHIYSLTQKGDLRPTKLAVAKSNQFRLLGQFAPDRAAEIVKRDPVFNQQVEKHKNQIQFFVPIEIAPGTELTQLAPKITFSGQVCTDQNVCMPILGEAVKGKFAGYFERTANKQNSAETGNDSTPSRRMNR